MELSSRNGLDHCALLHNETLKNSCDNYCNTFLDGQTDVVKPLHSASVCDVAILVPLLVDFTKVFVT